MDALLTYASLLLIVYAIGRRYLWPSLPSIRTILRTIPWTPPQAEARRMSRESAPPAPAPLSTNRDYVAQRHRAAMRHVARKRRAERGRTVEPHPHSEPSNHPNLREMTAYKPLDEAQEEATRLLIDLGWSNKRLYKLWKGTQQRRMAEIEEIRQAQAADRLAAEMAPQASDQVSVPPMEPLPSVEEIRE